MNKCKTCNCNSEGEYCFKHKPRKPLPKVGGFKKLTREVIVDAMNDIFFRNDFFMSIWKKRPHESEISGVFLPNDFDGNPSTAYFHHILPKNKYKIAEFDEENMVKRNVLLFASKVPLVRVSVLVFISNPSASCTVPPTPLIVIGKSNTTLFEVNICVPEVAAKVCVFAPVAVMPAPSVTFP